MSDILLLIAVSYYHDVQNKLQDVFCNVILQSCDGFTENVRDHIDGKDTARKYRQRCR